MEGKTKETLEKLLGDTVTTGEIHLSFSQQTLMNGSCARSQRSGGEHSRWGPAVSLTLAMIACDDPVLLLWMHPSLANSQLAFTRCPQGGRK